MPQHIINRRALIQLSGRGLTIGALAYFPVTGASVLTGMTGISSSVVAQPAAVVKDFKPDDVTAAARLLGKRPFKIRPNPLPPALANMSPAAQAQIRARKGSLIWDLPNSTFVIEPVHRTRMNPGTIDLVLVEDNKPRLIKFNPADFDYGNNKPPDVKPEAGLAGFRIYNRDEKGNLSNVAQFLAPDIFQAVGRNQIFGMATRPISIRTKDGKAEEPVSLIAIWIEKPPPGQQTMTIHALFNSRAMTGSLRFTIRPGIATIVDTECTLVARADIAEFGLSTMAAAHLSGSLNTRYFDDVRPNAYEIDGLQIHAGNGEWIWRPVTNGNTFQISSFTGNNPRGFGLLQRNRSFDSFLDDDNQWQQRPSLWIEPIGKWGEGQVRLFEIPTTSPINKNIGCSWYPTGGIKANAERHYVFRQFWGWTPPDKPDLAIVNLTRHGKPLADSNTRGRRFLISFAGEELFSAKSGTPIESKIQASSGQVTNVRLVPSRSSKMMRLTFDVIAGNAPLIELSVYLVTGEKRISETWLYRWTI